MPRLQTPQATVEWFCAEGPYQEYVAKMVNLNPGLRIPDPGNEKAPICTRQAAVTLLIVLDDGSVQHVFDMKVGQDTTSFTMQLRGSTGYARGIWLVEGLNSAIVEVLGDHFAMDPLFFLEYERTSIWRSGNNQPNLLRPLPSARTLQRLFCMPYYEVREIEPSFVGYSVGCMDTGRYIARNKINGSFVNTCIADRKCCFWSKNRPGGGWDVVILSDPPLKGLHVWGKRHDQGDTHTVLLTNNEPFQGGYRDFLPRVDVDTRLPPGPSRKSLKEDLCYYLQYPTVSAVEGLDQPKCIATLLQRIVASHYNQVLSYTHGLLLGFEWPLLRIDELQNAKMLWAEATWSLIQTSSRRCDDYVDAIKEIHLALGFGDRAEDSTTDNRPDTRSDFRYLLTRAEELSASAHSLNDAFTGLMGIVAAAQANREAKSVKILTILAMIFVPFSFTSGIFSMGAEYAPGGLSFWKFFVVSGLLLILVFAVAHLTDTALDVDGTWSVRNILMAKRKKYL